MMSQYLNKDDLIIDLHRQVTEAQTKIETLQHPWRSVDNQDWEYILSVIGDGGRDRFWKAVLTEMRESLTVVENRKWRMCE